MGHRSEKPVSAFGQCLDEPRPRDTVAEKFAESVDGLVDPTVEVDVSIWRLNGIAQFFSGDHIAARRDDQRQHVKRLPLNAQGPSSLLQRVSAATDVKVAKGV